MSASASPYTDACCDPGNPASAANVTSHPPGAVVDIGGVQCYEVGKGSPNVVLVSTDVFGQSFPNVRANADTIAAAGFRVVIPDLFKGDPFPADRFERPGAWEELKQQWWPKHTQEDTADFLLNAAKALKKDGSVRSIQAIGYCYGTIGALTVARQGLASSAVLCHPTGHTKDNTDLATVPLLFLCAEQDQAFTPEIREHWEKTLKENMIPARYITFPSTQHGFAVRDDGSPNGVQQRQRALQEAIAFFKQGAAV